MCVFLLHVLERVTLIPRAIGNVTWHRSYCQGPTGLCEEVTLTESIMPVLQQDWVWKMLVLPSQSFHLPLASALSLICCGSLLGITHSPTVIASSCPTAGEGHSFACDEQCVTSGQRGVSEAIPHQCSQPSDGGALWE